MKIWVTALVVGVLFGLGLGLSGMTRPGVVLGFLDVTGHWNPSLLAVMGGAVGISLPAYQWLFRQSHPLFSNRFQIPAARSIDRRLVIGSALFGVGWGLSGYCPGTGIVALAGGSLEAWTFTGSMLAGFYVFNRRSVAGATVTAEKTQ